VTIQLIDVTGQLLGGKSQTFSNPDACSQTLDIGPRHVAARWWWWNWRRWCQAICFKLFISRFVAADASISSASSSARSALPSNSGQSGGAVTGGAGTSGNAPGGASSGGGQSSRSSGSNGNSGLNGNFGSNGNSGSISAKTYVADLFKGQLPISFDEKLQLPLFSQSSSGRELSYELKKDSFTALSTADGRNILIRFSVGHAPQIGIEWHRNSSLLDGTVHPDVHFGVKQFGLLENSTTYPTTSRQGSEYIFSHFNWSDMTVTPDSTGKI
jgi:hypothetical protein